ncbi:tripartite tricarboxylate transporter substrate binding protein, partial [Stenotrophomonas sp. YIM B06876]|uniref:tripartite tricarboxylate transporter substrate binding protein n=1 Tax=Stenotrophomonas sp. YIM B06876 TaxID=3060211 RepID=UPI002738EB06
RVGVPVIVQNTAGAAGLIGSKAIAMAAPDGGTFGYVHSGIVTLQAMGAKIDMLKDFAPVAPRIQASSFLILVNSGSPYRSLQELIAAMKADPQKLSCGTTGPGSPEYMIFERLVKAVPGIGAVNVPFKGAIEGVAALMGKQIDFMVGLTSTARGTVESGKLRALANPGVRRSRLFPDVPTVAEAGVPGFAHSTWGGV